MKLKNIKNCPEWRSLATKHDDLKFILLNYGKQFGVQENKKTLSAEEKKIIYIDINEEIIKSLLRGEGFGPYREAKLNKPIIPWNETKLFGLCEFFVFPLIRLTLAVSLSITWPLAIVLYLPIMPILLFLGFILVGNSKRFISVIYDEHGRDDFWFPKVYTFINPFMIYNSKWMKKFMDRKG